ncbi:hypothetical protein PQR62_05875 [Herbaspirillum lusitanum]|jgi:3-methylfumaryl-CoA hydratase|uniref:3-methylfumaryl-CoA hydratase n=1 Tax=Herbaspirillum lusitanum TaxID=213312 RepID=A0ABW9A4H0_9BURK
MSAFSLRQAHVDQALPSRSYQVNEVQLFLYNAAIWNAHRIHYDLPYTREVEQHQALLVDGPLQGDWLMQLVYAVMDDGDTLESFNYQNRHSAYVGEPLVASGKVEQIDGNRVHLSLSISNAQGKLSTVGKAVVCSNIS